MFPLKIGLVLLAFLLQCSSNAKESVVTFAFFNSATGHAVSSSDITLQSRGETRSIPNRGWAFLQCLLEDGTWKANIVASGFASMSSSVAVIPNTASRIEFYLDPIALPAELQTEKIISLRRPDATLIVGFVVDDKTHQPLPEVIVRANGSEVKTDASGFYRIYLPLESSTVTPRLEFHRAGFQSEVRDNMETWANGDWICNIILNAGMGSNRIDARKTAEAQNGTEPCETCEINNSSDNFASTVVVPASIRVGRNCTGTSCTTVQVYSMQTYTKYVLPAEWYSCWGSLANGMNSLMAGAVSIRSYGLWYVYHPLTSSYDICDNTTCQVLGSVQSTNANNAVDATDRYIMTDAALANVMRAEYSAENNNKGCGDGYTGTGTSWPCIADFVCQTQTPNGHGRGVCQWGTVRWANGTRVTTASPCSQGIAHGLGTKTWQEILTHYYPNYSLTQGIAATLVSASPESTLVRPGSTFTIRCTLRTSDDMVLMVGAAVAPAGTTNYTYDAAHDVKLSFFAGEFPASRQFTAPTTPWGQYDMVVSLWFDKNNNNIIDTGDILLSSQLYANAFLLSNPNSVEELRPAAFRLYQNYPNPFNPETTIRFSVATIAHASLQVFDVLGREVTTLFNGKAQPGTTYTVKLNADKLASGVYFYKLQSGNQSELKKLILLE